VGATTIEPGGQTTVSVSMMMHKGMEGPHLFRITVPVQGPSGEKADLQLYVKADFR